VFKKRASEYVTLLASSPFAEENMEFELNPSVESIKRGSFEISIIDDKGESATVWSGVKLGPPRRQKFPENEDLLGRVKKSLE
jgi:hypothetical protein